MHNRLRNKNMLAVPAAVIAALGMTACGSSEAEPKEAVVTVTETPTPTVDAPSETPSTTPEASPTTPESLFDEDLQVKSAAEFNERYKTAQETKDLSVDEFTDLVNNVKLDESEMKNESTIATSLAKGIAARDRAIFASGFDMPSQNEEHYRSQGDLDDSADEFKRDADAYIDIDNRIEAIYPYKEENEIHNLSYKEPEQAFMKDTWTALTQKYAARVLEGDRDSYNLITEVDPDSLDFDITKAGNVTISATTDVYDNIPQGDGDGFYNKPSATSYSWEVEGKYDEETGELEISKRSITEFKTAEDATNMLWPSVEKNQRD